ncbi:MAG TPA: hypothetical protein VGD37_33370 [Kofleriaceae bacterium]|jgi:hypothetical protein
MTLALHHWRSALALAALAAGCGSTKHPVDDNPGDVGQPQSDSPPDTTPQDPGPPDGDMPQPPACRTAATTGSTVFALDTGVGGLTLHSDVAVDPAGDVFYARATGDAFSVAKYAPDGRLVYRVPFGEVVAVDAKGNAYIAASFTKPLDIGLGVMVPDADMDVFVAKLAPDGTPVFARPLGMCPDSVRSIAVAADGRIAVSGDEMGTVVLDASGKLLFMTTFSGALAFDSAGNLIVGGSFMGTLDLGGGTVFQTGGDLDGFVVKLDRDGNAVWSLQIGDASLPIQLLASGTPVTAPTRQLVASVAVGPGDEVVFVGQFDYDVKLFDSDHVAAMVDIASVPLRSGGFIVALDASGKVKLQEVRLGLDGYSDVAVDARGSIIATGMELAEASPPFRDALLTKLDASGNFLFGRTNEIGAGHAVAADACGNVFWSASIRKGGPDQPMMAHLFKLAP